MQDASDPVAFCEGAKGGSEVAPSTKQPSIAGLEQAATHAACIVCACARVCGGSERCVMVIVIRVTGRS